MSRVSFKVVVLLLLTIGGAFRAGDAVAGVSSRIIYSRVEGELACPDESVLRAGVAQRLGYDPFVAYAKTTVVAELFRDGSKLRARAYIVDDNGERRGSRELASETDDCRQLVSALALAISIALDPMTAIRPSPPAAGGAPVPTSPAPDTALSKDASAERPGSASDSVVDVGPSLPARQATAAARWMAHVEAGTFISSGWLPATSAGVRAGFRVAPPLPWSFGLEGEAQLPANQAAASGPGRAAAWTWSASFVPCWHWPPAVACALATFGQIIAHGEGVSLPLEQTAVYGAIGARLALEWQFDQRWALALHGDLTAPLERTRLALNGSDLWTSPAIGGALGLGIVSRVW